MEDLYIHEKKELCDKIRSVNRAKGPDNKDKEQKKFVSFLESLSEEVRKRYFRSDVRTLAEKCQITVDELGEIHGYRINSKLNQPIGD